MNLRIFDSLEELTRAAARTILQREHRSVAISGGSTPQPLYELLAPQLSEDDPVTWVLVDERYVPKSDPQSNAAMIERTLFARGLPASHRWVHFDTSLPDAAASAAKFAREFCSSSRAQTGDHPADGREVAGGAIDPASSRGMNWETVEPLDIVLLGCGDDGHTASLFPGTPVLDVEDRVASAVYVPRLGQWRVTLTKPVIRAAKLRIVLATGASKAPILREVREGVPHPVALATSGVETWWFVDRAAAP